MNIEELYEIYKTKGGNSFVGKYNRNLEFRLIVDSVLSGYYDIYGKKFGRIFQSILEKTKSWTREGLIEMYVSSPMT